MSDELISVIDLANQYGKRKQRIFKVLKRLGIEPKKLPGVNNRGQIISYITNEESRLVVNELLSGSTASGVKKKTPNCFLKRFSLNKEFSTCYC